MNYLTVEQSEARARRVVDPLLIGEAELLALRARVIPRAISEAGERFRLWQEAILRAFNAAIIDEDQERDYILLVWACLYDVLGIRPFTGSWHKDPIAGGGLKLLWHKGTRAELLEEVHAEKKAARELYGRND